MDIHEYQAKMILRNFGISTGEGYSVTTISEAVDAATKLSGSSWVVKSQIHAGGRGKGKFKKFYSNNLGGIRLAKSYAEVKKFANEMLGNTLVTKQTGIKGKKVNCLYIENSCDIANEFYLSLYIDRSTCRVSFMASTEGGIDIEKVAKETPEKISSFSIDPLTGVLSLHSRYLANLFRLNGIAEIQIKQLAVNLYKAFVEKDMKILEINPLVLTNTNKLICLDAKISFDDNALYRHTDIIKLRDSTEEDIKEIKATKYNLSYISLDGEIGCMVNGAGLAMATMDIIKLYGSSPANFLDVGGSATSKKITEAFKIIMSDYKVKGILVNIFAGIMRCDIIAKGIIEAVKELAIKVPLVIRLEGTNVNLGKKFLLNSDIKIILANDLDDAAQKIIKAVKEN